MPCRTPAPSRKQSLSDISGAGTEGSDVSGDMDVRSGYGGAWGWSRMRAHHEGDVMVPVKVEDGRAGGPQGEVVVAHGSRRSARAARAARSGLLNAWLNVCLGQSGIRARPILAHPPVFWGILTVNVRTTQHRNR